MRSSRRHRFVGQFDNAMEILYRVYVGGVFGAVAFAVLAASFHDTGVGAEAADEIARQGPGAARCRRCPCCSRRTAVRGQGRAARDRGRRGPVPPLAPVDRGMALRPGALRQMRVGVFTGAVLGAVAGNFAFRRLPGSPAEWFACLTLFGALIPLCTLSCALVASGRRLRPTVATAIGAALLAWSLADILLGLETSPATMLGVLATLHLQDSASLVLAPVGVVAAIAVTAFGLAWLSAVAVEAARRRATLTDQLRFSASVQTFAPSFSCAVSSPPRCPAPALDQVASPGSGPVADPPRAGQSFLRWPPSRLIRTLAVGAAAGALVVGVWNGTTPLVALAGVVLLLPAFDVVEPLAQEVDHPLRRDLLPVQAGIPTCITWLRRRLR